MKQIGCFSPPLTAHPVMFYSSCHSSHLYTSSNWSQLCGFYLCDVFFFHMRNTNKNWCYKCFIILNMKVRHIILINVIIILFKGKQLWCRWNKILRNVDRSHDPVDDCFPKSARPPVCYSLFKSSLSETDFCSMLLYPPNPPPLGFFFYVKISKSESSFTVALLGFHLEITLIS